MQCLRVTIAVNSAAAISLTSEQKNSSCIGEYFGAALAADLLRHRGAADSG
jgi:hypothetical protein